ncbi:MAG: hypothetical protein ABI137_06270, partial [Antricoccus sp.]
MKPPLHSLSDDALSALAQTPDDAGYFGDFGGRFIPEALVTAVEELTDEYHKALTDQAFTSEFAHILS